MQIKVTALDRLFSKYIRLRAKGICERCGVTTRLQTSHFHGRRKKSVRWHEDNACALCFTCHQYLTENPLEHTVFFVERLGKEKFEMLNVRANYPGSKVDIEAETLYLKEKIKECEV